MTAAAGQQRPEPARLRVVVTVGTDHHPFDRLVQWVNDWLAAHPRQAAGFFMQSGSTSVVPACLASRSVEVQRLDALLDEANVVVCHGGPATIAAVWARGLLPIVVPRQPQLGEHVDDHQVDFSRKLAELGRIRLAQTPAEFAGIMAAATNDPVCLRTSVAAADVAAAVARFGELVEEVVSRPLRRLPLWHRNPRISHRPMSVPFAPAVNMPSGLIPSQSTGLDEPNDAEQGQLRSSNEAESRNKAESPVRVRSRGAGCCDGRGASAGVDNSVGSGGVDDGGVAVGGSGGEPA